MDRSKTRLQLQLHHQSMRLYNLRPVY